MEKLEKFSMESCVMLMIWNSFCFMQFLNFSLKHLSECHQLEQLFAQFSIVYQDLFPSIFHNFHNFKFYLGKSVKINGNRGNLRK